MFQRRWFQGFHEDAPAISTSTSRGRTGAVSRTDAVRIPPAPYLSAAAIATTFAVRGRGLSLPLTARLDVIKPSFSAAVLAATVNSPRVFRPPRALFRIA